MMPRCCEPLLRGWCNLVLMRAAPRACCSLSTPPPALGPSTRTAASPRRPSSRSGVRPHPSAPARRNLAAFPAACTPNTPSTALGPGPARYSGSTRSSAGPRRMKLVISSKNELRYRQHFIRRHVPLTCGFATPLPAPSLYSRPRCHARRRLGWVTIADIHFVLGSETPRPFRAPRGQLRAS